MVVFSIMRSVANDTKNGALALSNLDLEFAADPTVAAAGLVGLTCFAGNDTFCVNFEVAVDQNGDPIPPSQAVEDAVDVVLSNHEGVVAPLVKFLAGILAEKYEVPIAADLNWELIGWITCAVDVFGEPEKLTGALNFGANVVEGAGGEKPQVRITEVLGDDTAPEVLGLFALDATAGVMKALQKFTTVPPRPGLNYFRIEARLNGAASLDIRSMALYLFKILSA